MNKTLWQFISIIVITFIIFFAYSFSDFQIKVGDVAFEKAGFKDFLNAVPTAKGLALRSPKNMKNDADSEKVVIDTTSQRILLIGDSMLEGLMLRLRDYAALNGHEFKSVIWYSSQSKWFGTYDTLKYFIRTYKPTYVMLVLGANELFVPDIKTKRLKYVKNIVKDMDTIPFVWVGPPNWKEDTGINDLILENAGKNHYFESKKLTYKRFKDGAHPTHESAAIWMDSIASWIRTKSTYRFKMEQPTEKYKGSPNATLLQPLKE
jgi:hypothetical protein